MKTYSVLLNKSHSKYLFSEEFDTKLSEITGVKFPSYYLERHDTRLIDAFKNSINDPNGWDTQLEIEEVPVGLNYEIHELDGGYEILTKYLLVTIDELTKGLSEEKLQLLSYTKDLRVAL
jgi:hypothetical protein